MSNFQVIEQALYQKAYLKIVENQLHLLYIYDKSVLENLTEKEIDTIILKQTS